ncbi:MAG TPA: endo-1,3-alpha-glucanase family glycosylhydrolase [Chitinophagaceae bacterium]
MHISRIAMAMMLMMAQPRSGSRDLLKDDPVLSLPLTSYKCVIAHCMTNIIRYKGHKLEDSCDPGYYSSTGNSTASLGGLTQVNVLEDPVLREASLDQAVEWEMRAALRTGIDGFQFYYPLGNTISDTIIRAYLRVATQKKIPFKFTLCISHPSGSTEAQKIAAFATRINSILDDAGRNNDHWLRTPDGRLIVYMWYGENLADIPAAQHDFTEAYYVARAYKRLADAVHEKFACIFSINENISDARLADYLDYFPATWVWTLPYSDQYIGKKIAAASRRRHRTFTGSAFADFYTSKLLQKGSWNMYHQAADAVAAGIGGVERKYIATGLSLNFRKLLEFAISEDAPIINIITWNDYPEGHHLAPEANHNDGFAQLLLYYKQLWKKENPLPGSKEIAIAFFKKYRHDAEPSPYNIPVVAFQQETIPWAAEDSIEVVTLLRQPATLLLNGNSFQVAAGLVATRIPSRPGAITVQVNRNGHSILNLAPPEWITAKPYRTDRLTYAISSDYSRFHEDIFGNTPITSSHEYNHTAENNIN